MTETRDWHRDPITTDTVIDAGYRNTQNVRRFFKAGHWRSFFTFDRLFMAWYEIPCGGRRMGEAVNEWLRRKATSRIIP